MSGHHQKKRGAARGGRKNPGRTVAGAVPAPATSSGSVVGDEKEKVAYKEMLRRRVLRTAGSSNSGPLPSIVGGKYRVERRIGSGSYGDVHLGVDIETGEEVAMKMERIRGGLPTVRMENDLYTCLRKEDGFPRALYLGQERGYNVLVMDLLGPSLEDLFNRCKRSFTVETVAMIGVQLVNRLEQLHGKGFIHRDVKPNNLCVGRGENSAKLFMIDFGLARHFRKFTTGEHVPLARNVAFKGTPKFASVNALSRLEQSRRDDMEGVGYTLVYLLKGSLPWDNGTLARNRNQRLERLIEKKKKFLEDGNWGQSYPAEFAQYFNYCRQLGFEALPDYDHLRKLFQNVLDRSSPKIMDWIRLNEWTGEGKVKNEDEGDDDENEDEDEESRAV